MRWLARSSVEYFSHCTETFHWGTLLCFRKNLLSKKFGARERERERERERGVARLSVENDSSHGTGTFRAETLLCFSKLFVSKNVREMRGYLDFLSKLFCLKAPKQCVEEPFCVSENLCYRKMLEIREGVSQFSVEFVLSHSTKILRKGSLV